MPDRERRSRVGAPRIVGSAVAAVPAAPAARSFGSVISAPSLPGSKGRGKGRGVGPAATTPMAATRRFAVSGRRRPCCRVRGRFRNRSWTTSAMPERERRPRGRRATNRRKRRRRRAGCADGEIVRLRHCVAIATGARGRGKGRGVGPAATITAGPRRAASPSAGGGRGAAGCRRGTGSGTTHPRRPGTPGPGKACRESSVGRRLRRRRGRSAPSNRIPRGGGNAAVPAATAARPRSRGLRGGFQSRGAG